MREFHSLSVTEQLYRLAEIAHQPYTRSPRDKRSSVALIFKLAPSTTPPTNHTPTAPPQHPPPPPPPLPPPPPPSPYSRYIDPTPSYPRLIHALHSLSLLPTTRNSQLHLLFIQRSRNPRDRWSGQMALPGGRQQSGETDYHTAVREVEEEVGLQLTRDDVLYIGRLSDRHINSYGNVKPLAVCPFIFLLTAPAPSTPNTPNTPNAHSLRLDSKEVGAAVWTPLSYFTSDTVRFAYMVHPLVIQTTHRWQQRNRSRKKVEIGYRVKKMDSSLSAPSLTHSHSLSHSHQQTSSQTSTAGSGLLSLLPTLKLPSLFSLPSVQFPALALPGEFETADGRRGVSLGDTLLYYTPSGGAHASTTSSSSSSSTASATAVATTPSPLLSTPVAPPSPLPVRSAEASAASTASTASSSSSLLSTTTAATPLTDSDGDGDDGTLFSSKMEHDIDVEPGTFILWGFTLVTLSDLLRDGLGVRSLSDRIDTGQKDRARMLLWLHRSIDAMDRVGKGVKNIKDTLLGSGDGGAGVWAAQHDGGHSSHGEKQVAASLSRGIAAAASGSSGKEADKKKDGGAGTAVIGAADSGNGPTASAPASTTQSSTLTSKL